MARLKPGSAIDRVEACQHAGSLFPTNTHTLQGTSTAVLQTTQQDSPMLWWSGGNPRTPEMSLQLQRRRIIVWMASNITSTGGQRLGMDAEAWWSEVAWESTQTTRAETQHLFASCSVGILTGPEPNGGITSPQPLGPAPNGEIASPMQPLGPAPNGEVARCMQSLGPAPNGKVASPLQPLGPAPNGEVAGPMQPLGPAPDG